MRRISRPPELHNATESPMISESSFLFSIILLDLSFEAPWLIGSCISHRRKKRTSRRSSTMIITALTRRGEGNTKLEDFSLPNPGVWPPSEPYLSKHSLGPELIVVSAALTAVSLITVTARLYTRAVLLGFVGADDYCILLAAVCISGFREAGSAQHLA